MEENIVAKINSSASSLTEEEISSWVVPQLVTHYKGRIGFLARRVYGSNLNEVARAAFFEAAKETLQGACKTFLFKSQHWKYGRDINTYLLTCLRRLASQTYWNQVNAKRTSILVCPACKILGERSFLIPENGKQRCRSCTKEIDRLDDEIKKLSARPKEKAAMMARQNLHRCFALHSRHGYKCPDCSQFIPSSYNGKYAISCPYGDCYFSGDIKNLTEMSHPASLSIRENVSLDAPIPSADGGNEKTIGDKFAAEIVSPEFQIALSENFSHELDVLQDVINGQIAQVKRTNAKGTYIQKLLMYEAIKSMVQKFPEEMVSYLVHLKQNAENPIQARIFQEYVRMIEDALPFQIDKRGEMIEIMSISDPNLNLFVGTSVFKAVVKESGIIPNNTIETYTGSRKFKMFGPCFLGKIVNIIDDNTGESLMEKIKGWTFVQIQTEGIPAGTPVTVTHFRIPSHYEMGALVFLQRLRRNIVDKVYLRLHGARRPVGHEQKVSA